MRMLDFLERRAGAELCRTAQVAQLCATEATR